MPSHPPPEAVPSGTEESLPLDGIGHGMAVARHARLPRAAASAFGMVPSSIGPANLTHAVRKRLTLQGFIVSDHPDRQPQFHADMTAWIQAGKLKWEETIVDGLENTPKAFIGLFTGDNMGKMLVRLTGAQG